MSSFSASACPPPPSVLSQMAHTYYFFVNGFPERLWDTLPPDLHPTDQLRATLKAGQAVRPAGKMLLQLPLPVPHQWLTECVRCLWQIMLVTTVFQRPWAVFVGAYDTAWQVESASTCWAPT